MEEKEKDGMDTTYVGIMLAVFLVIAYAGTVSRRIAGVLLTFPILNGIAIVASPQPVVVADAIYPLVIFNWSHFLTRGSRPSQEKRIVEAMFCSS